MYLPNANIYINHDDYDKLMEYREIFDDREEIEVGSALRESYALEVFNTNPPSSKWILTSIDISFFNWLDRHSLLKFGKIGE